MKYFVPFGVALSAVVCLAACQTSDQDVIITSVEVAELPADILSVVKTARPDFVPQEIEKKVRASRTYYDIEGTSSGMEIEFDVLMTETGPTIVEIQRDLAWSDVPASVRETYAREIGADTAVRIIESIQSDHSIIYELFLAGAPSEPSFEIRTRDDAPPQLLSKRWEH